MLVKKQWDFGDVKLMGALGLFFGLTNIILISVLAFLYAAIIGIIVIIVKRKKAAQYMAFGPFIVLATVTTIFVPFSILFDLLLTIFSLGLNKR